MRIVTDVDYLKNKALQRTSNKINGNSSNQTGARYN